MSSFDDPCLSDSTPVTTHCSLCCSIAVIRPLIVSWARARQPSLLISSMLLGADLRCHCLNFHGRVKEASVKNFQLVRL